MTQKEKILNHLKRNKYLTRRTAMNVYGIGNLPARIGELRAAGFDIVTVPKKGKGDFKNFGAYMLAERGEQNE